MSFVFILTVPKESLGPQRKILSFYKVLSVNSELKHFLDNCNYFLSTSLLAVYADLNNLKIINDLYGHEEGDFSIRLVGQFLQDSIGKRGVCGRIGGDEFACLVPTKQCPGICTGRCTPHSTFLIERAKKHIILLFPPAFICFRKTWIPHFRRCSRMRMQCFTRRNRNEIRMLRKFYQNRN